jgi:hypothetical protein
LSKFIRNSTSVGKGRLRWRVKSEGDSRLRATKSGAYRV